MSNRFLAILTLTGLTGLLAACGDDPPEAPEPPGPPAVVSVEVTAPTMTLAPGDELQLTATAHDSGGDVLGQRPMVWATSDSTVATVSSTGLVTALTAGEVDISATSEGQTGAVLLTVSDETPVVGWIEIDPPGEVWLDRDVTLQVTATVYSQTGEILTDRIVTWESDDTAVATISASGLVTARGPGSAWIAAVCEDHRDEMLVRVLAADTPVASIELDATALTLLQGDSHQLTAIARGPDGEVLTGRTASWSSDTPSVATVTSTGHVETGFGGDAVITVAIENQTAQVAITVLAPVARVVLDHDQTVIVVDEGVQLTADVRDAANLPLSRPVTWTSDRPDIATVDGDGIVLGRSVGAAIITATSGGVSATAQIFVSSWTDRELSTVDGAALPRTLTTYTETVGGVTRTVRWDVDAGILRVRAHDGRYELGIFATRFTEGSPPVAGYIEHTGTRSWDPVAGSFVYAPDSPVEPSFSGGDLPDGRSRIVMDPLLRGSPSTLVFAAPAS